MLVQSHQSQRLVIITKPPEDPRRRSYSLTVDTRYPNAAIPQQQRLAPPYPNETAPVKTNFPALLLQDYQTPENVEVGFMSPSEIRRLMQEKELPRIDETLAQHQRFGNI